MPYYPDGKQEKGIPYETEHFWEHTVAEYLGCSVFEVMELDIVDFLALRREAFITQVSKTEEGKEYLRNARLYESDEFDEESLDKLFGGEG